MEVKTTSEKETLEIGRKLSKSLKAGDVVCLYGDLGAGKTVLVRGIAHGLGIKKRILSPTFVLMRTYPGLYHLDLYRISDFSSLGLDEIFESKAIKVIEWAEKLENALPAKRIDIKIEKVDENTRRITITHSSVILNTNEVNVKDLNKAISVLTSGGVVIFPTDTVYGIGCLASNPKAVEKIYRIKGTAKTQHFPILVSGEEQVEKLAEVSGAARNLISKHWPGGLTVLLKSKTTGEKIGFRMPDLKILLDIINKVGPIIGTSANFHGKNTPSSYEELDPKLINLVDFVIKGECKKGIESTVVDTTVDPPKILRRGAVKL